jgi:hypothetical protein
VSIANPSEAALAAELESQKFRFGVRRGFWRLVEVGFPFLVMTLQATNADGSDAAYSFQFELSGFPGTAPAVKIWDIRDRTLLATNKRPEGPQRVQEAFKSWGNETVYRPWDRHAGAHNNWAQTYPQLAWTPTRGLAFILEDLHELLNVNPRAGSAGEAA